jgi:hypothetical protein
MHNGPMTKTQTHTAQDTATYELCYSPSDADMLIYRSIPAGICGPFSESIPCASRADAERIAFSMGYLIAGEWQSHTNYDSADLAPLR